MSGNGYFNPSETSMRLYTQMSAHQAETFWKQMYHNCLRRHNLTIPAVPLPPLSEIRKIVKEGQTPADDLGYPSYPRETVELATRYLPAMELFHKQVLGYTKTMPVPQSVLNRLIPATLRGGGDVDEDELDSVEMSVSGSEQDQTIEKIAVCTCPHCWIYMESLPRFMDHLWDSHAMLERIGPPNDSEDEEEHQEPAGSEDAEHTDVEGAEQTTGSVENLDWRKDSGYSDTMDVDHDREVGDHELIMSVEHTEEQEKPKRVSILHVIDPGLLTEDCKDGADGTVVPRSTDPSFWRKLLENPYKMDELKQQQANPPSESRDQPKNGNSGGVEAQKVRDGLNIKWYDSKTMALGSPLSPRGKIKLPGVPASQMRGRSSNEGMSMSAGINSPDTTRYWICAHDEDCHRRFDSLLLYVEHLTKRGLVAYRYPDQIEPSAIMTLSELRASQKGI